MYDSPKGLNYRIFKENLSFENYLIKLPVKQARVLCKFRTCNLKLPIETGRWHNVPRYERKCNLCNLYEIGDEFHYLFKCTENEIVKTRKSVLPQYYYIRPNIFKFHDLFNTNNVSLLKNIYKLISVVKERVCPPG